MEAQEHRCPRCGGELTATTHRGAVGEHQKPGKGAQAVRSGNQQLCFNGKRKSEHVCVAECSKKGLFCQGCRNLIDISGRE